jgi:hypothetical protein
LILLSPPNAQVPKGLVPCAGGHDIAFIYPLILCRGVVFLEQEFPKTVWTDRGWGSKKQIFEMKKE